MLKHILIFACLCAPQFGCYEGWENYKGEQGETEPPPPPEQPKIKPIYYVLYQPIRMNAATTKATTCFANQSIVEYKNNEWDSRITKTTLMLEEIAEVVVVNPIGISASDCQKVAAVSAMADSLSPWGTGDAPGQDALERLTVHLKEALWEEEPTASPNSRVTKAHWAGFQKIKNGGKSVFSGHHFVVSNDTNGFFTEWMEALPASSVLEGSPIDNPDPSEAGLGARNTNIDNDVQQLKTWLTSATPN